MRAAALLLLSLALLSAALSACGKKPSYVDPPVTAGDPKPVFEQLQPPATASAPTTTAQLPTNPRESRSALGRGADKGGYPHAYPKPWL